MAADVRGAPEGRKMLTGDESEAERLIQQLKERGWQEQRAGTMFYRGTLSTNLLKDGQVLTIVQDLCPPVEFVQHHWGYEAIRCRE